MTKLSFNRPVLYTSLLSEQAVGIDGNHPVYASVASDEFTIRTPDALMNGMATESLIQSCCPSLNVTDLLLCDIQHLLAIIKIATQGNLLEILLKCPKCHESDPYEINLQQVVPFLTAKKWFETLCIDDLFITFRSPTYEEFSTFAIADFKISKQLFQLTHLDNTQDYNNIIASLLEQKQKLHLNFQTLCVASISNNDDIFTNSKTFIKEWFEQCEISRQKQIVAYIEEAKKDQSLKDFNIVCSHCSNPFVVPIDLDLSNQFRQKLIPASEQDILDLIKQMGEETKALTNDLLKMIWYMRGSISYTEAFSLSVYERECIAKIIENNVELTKESGLVFV